MHLQYKRGDAVRLTVSRKIHVAPLGLRVFLACEESVAGPFEVIAMMVTNRTVSVGTRALEEDPMVSEAWSHTDDLLGEGGFRDEILFRVAADTDQEWWALGDDAFFTAERAEAARQAILLRHAEVECAEASKH